LKKWLLLLLGVSIISIMAGCESYDMNYQGKLRPVNEVEEMLADYLESENPDREFTVDIVND
jgi:hypothetical protein